ncbi:hypothetical protein GJB61_13885 [Paenibacillus sp. LC-T2]|uniref:Glycosyl hydrolase n=2 Tax=Paenibacillus monticola TaxID=2666075 RepID=A0A7X2H5U4_9BACL|nr:hypothetical protein [Paenibacillus monticola]
MSLVLLAACSGNKAEPSPTSSHSVTQSDEQVLYNFINTKLTGPYGVFTNFQETDQNGEAASGHEILSESAGLMMRVAVLTGNKELFAAQWKLAQQTFDMKDGFSYRYSPKLDKQYPVNAAVDDLRLIRALYEAGEIFGETQYTEQADKYGRRFYDNNVENGYLRDFYDENYKIANESITLCYINLSTMQKLSISDELRGILLGNMNDILKGGYLSDQFPFYETRFDYKTDKYGSENINTVESLLSILSLAEVDQQKASSIKYIKQQVDAGTLFGQYTKEGVPANDIHSTAIYAITAMIGSEIGDEILYRQSIARMNELRVSDSSSALYGGFGDVHNKQAYSFDNLMALLAYSY